MLQFFSKPKDFYDLAAVLEINGIPEAEAKIICDYVDKKKRTDLILRKTIAKIFNRNICDLDDLKVISKYAPHCLPKDHFTNDELRAKSIIKHLRNEASPQPR